MIGDRLDNDHPRLRPNGLIDRIQIAGIGFDAGDTEAVRFLRQQERAASVKLIADDDVIALLQLRKDYRGQCAHSRRGNRSPLGTVQLAALFGQNIGVRMSIALVNISGSRAP